MVKEKNIGYDLFGETDRWYPVLVDAMAGAAFSP